MHVSAMTSVPLDLTRLMLLLIYYVIHTAKISQS